MKVPPVSVAALPRSICEGGMPAVGWTQAPQTSSHTHDSWLQSEAITMDYLSGKKHTNNWFCLWSEEPVRSSKFGSSSSFP